MNLNVRTQRSIPSRLNAVALTKYTGACVVRKKLRIAGIPVRGFVWTTRLGPDGAIVWGPGARSSSRWISQRATPARAATPTTHQSPPTLTGAFRGSTSRPGPPAHAAKRTPASFAGHVVDVSK